MPTVELRRDVKAHPIPELNELMEQVDDCELEGPLEQSWFAYEEPIGDEYQLRMKINWDTIAQEWEFHDVDEAKYQLAWCGLLDLDRVRELFQPLGKLEVGTPQQGRLGHTYARFEGEYKGYQVSLVIK